jgi:hypothetical protein
LGPFGEAGVQGKDQTALVEQVVKTLSDQTFQCALESSLSALEWRLLTAVALLGEPAAAELGDFFAGDLPYPVFHAALIALEKRLVLYRVREGGESRLALNPFLEPVLRPYLRNPRVLFPGLPLAGELPFTGERLRVDDRLFAVVLATVLEVDSGGTVLQVRKQIASRLCLLFPDLKVHTLLDALLGLGLLGIDYPQGLEGCCRVYPHPGRWRAFQQRSSLERRIYAVAGAVCFGAGPKYGVPRNEEIQDCGCFIARFLGLLEPRRRYAWISLTRGGELLLRDATADYNLSRVMRALEDLGLIAEDAPGYWRRTEDPAEPSPDAGPVATMDGPFSLILSPEISLKDAVSLAWFCVPRNQSGSVGMELTRASVVRGFDRGLKARDLLKRLKRLCGNQIDKTLPWILADWQHSYGEVSLYGGRVLVLSEEWQHIVKARALAALLLKPLSPGAYLLSRTNPVKILAALRKAGVDTVAQPKELSPNSGLSASGAWYRALKTGFPASLPPYAGSQGPAGMPPLPSEAWEAQGRDEVGKAYLVQDAITAQAILEVWWPGAEGDRYLAGKPWALKKCGGESVLILAPLGSRDGVARCAGKERAIRLPLSQIRRLRRMESSFFEEPSI